MSPIDVYVLLDVLTELLADLIHEPISKPIYPPPTIAIFFGTLDKLKAPVDESIFSSSNFTPGSANGSDPVLIIEFFVSIIVCFLLLSVIKISFFDLKLAIYHY